MVFTSRGRRMCRLESMARALQMVFILLFFLSPSSKKLCLVVKHIIKGEKRQSFLGDIIHKSYIHTHYYTIRKHDSHTRFKLVAKGGKELYRVT